MRKREEEEVEEYYDLDDDDKANMDDFMNKLNAIKDKYGLCVMPDISLIESNEEDIPY